MVLVFRFEWMDDCTYFTIARGGGVVTRELDLWTYYIGDDNDGGDCVSQLPCPCIGSTKRSGSINVFGCKEGMGIYKQWAYTCPSTKKNKTLTLTIWQTLNCNFFAMQFGNILKTSIVHQDQLSKLEKTRSVSRPGTFSLTIMCLFGYLFAIFWIKLFCFFYIWGSVIFVLDVILVIWKLFWWFITVSTWNFHWIGSKSKKRPKIKTRYQINDTCDFDIHI